MKKIIIIAVIVLAVAAVYFWKYVGQEAYVPVNNQPQNQATTTSETQSLSANIEIKGYAFNPQVLTVKKGTTVKWTNQDQAIHDVKFSSFTSPSFGQGGSYEFRFDEVGAYEYICGLHPLMHGTIIVEP